MGSIDKTLSTLKHDNDFILVQIYVNDIIFGGSSLVLASKISGNDGERVTYVHNKRTNIFLRYYNTPYI
jgi:hypothetical protein